MADDSRIEVHEYFGDEKPEVRTGISPWCQRGEHFDCVSIKFEEGKPPQFCVCPCHLAPE
jgi:hypothetical protein